jgi:hypothetical protein
MPVDKGLLAYLFAGSTEAGRKKALGLPALFVFLSNKHLVNGLPACL